MYETKAISKGFVELTGVSMLASFAELWGHRRRRRMAKHSVLLAIALVADDGKRASKKCVGLLPARRPYSSAYVSLNKVLSIKRRPVFLGIQRKISFGWARA
jgi:hypothetical protein